MPGEDFSKSSGSFCVRCAATFWRLPVKGLPCSVVSGVVAILIPYACTSVGWVLWLPASNFAVVIDLFACGELGGAPEAGVAQLGVQALEREAADDLVIEQARVDGVGWFVGDEDELVEARCAGEEQLCSVL